MHCLSKASKHSLWQTCSLHLHVNVKLYCIASPLSCSSSPSSTSTRTKTTPSPSAPSSHSTPLSTSSPSIAEEIKQLEKRRDFISLTDVHKLLDRKDLSSQQAEQIIHIVKKFKSINEFIYKAYLRRCARNGDIERVNRGGELCSMDAEVIGEIEGIMRIRALAVRESTPFQVLLQATTIALIDKRLDKAEIFTELISYFTITKGTMEGLDQVMKMMIKEKVALNEHGFRRYIHPLELARDYPACMRAFYQLRHQNLLAGDTGANYLIILFGKADFGGIADLYQSEFANRTPPREVYEALIQFYFDRRENVSVLRLFNEATQTIDLSAHTFAKAFNSCAWLVPNELPKMRSYVSARSWLLDKSVYNSMLETYSSKSMLNECLDLFNDMQNSPHVPDSRTYNIIINHFGRARQIDAMLALFRTMQNNQITPNATTYAHLIFWHSVAGASSSAIELINEALSKNIAISVSTFGAFIDMCMDKKDEDTCKVVIQNMVDHKMGDVAYQALLGRYSKEGNANKMASLFKDVEGHGIKITPEMHEVVLKNIINSKNSAKCKELVEELEVKGIRLSSRAYSDLLKFYSQNDPNSCAPLLQKMREWKLVPELSAYEFMLTTLLKSNKFEECRKLFESMRDIHLLPSTSAYNLVMSATGKLGDLEYCERLLAEMRKSGPYPDKYTYNTILSHSNRARDSARIAKLRAQMKQDGIPPTVVAYGILINNASRSFDVAGALHLFAEMKENNVTPDAVVYHDLLLLLLRANDHELVMKVYQEMIQNGYTPQMRLYTLLFRHLEAIKEYSTCLELMQEMHKNGVEPDEKLTATMRKIVDAAQTQHKRDEQQKQQQQRAMEREKTVQTREASISVNKGVMESNASEKEKEKVKEIEIEIEKMKVKEIEKEEVVMESFDSKSLEEEPLDKSVFLLPSSTCTTEQQTITEQEEENSKKYVNPDVIAFLKMCAS